MRDRINHRGYREPLKAPFLNRAWVERTTSPLQWAAEGSPGLKPGVTLNKQIRAPKGRQSCRRAHLVWSVARFAGSLPFFTHTHRADARGYYMPRLRYSSLATLIGLVILSWFPGSLGTSFAQTQSQAQAASERHRYDIQLTLDFDKRSYTGTERVRFVNQGTRATSTLYFHLYSNLRVPGYLPPKKTESGEAVSDEPRLEVLEVRTANTNAPIPFTLEDQDTTLRVNLRELIAPKAATEIVITFKGAVPEIDPEETGLVAHVMQQVSAAIGSAREFRRARGINFRCRGVLLLGSWYPVLAARAGDDWLRRMDPSIGDSVVADVADYQVTIDGPQGVSVFTPVEASNVTSKDGRTATTFSAESLRDFVVVAGSNMRAEQRVISGITIRSIYRNEHETAARRALNIAADAVNVYVRRIGPLPLRTISLVDAPLVATLSNAEFSGFVAIASAFYLDFDSPAVSSMPDIIREQRASVEESLEWTVAHVVAHQWWGTTVGNDPSREPVLDEALANWSALLYYREVHGEKKAEVALEEQLRGVYKLYRTFRSEERRVGKECRSRWWP